MGRSVFDLDKDFEALEFENQRRNLKVGKQIGSTTIKIDAKRKALAPGKRRSKDGNIYYENRRNRSDAVGKKI